MCLGVTMGYLTHRLRHPRLVAGHINTATIVALMLLLGGEVGGNDYVISNLGTIGVAALLLSLGAITGTLLAAKALWRLSFSAVQPRATSTNTEQRTNTEKTIPQTAQQGTDTETCSPEEISNTTSTGSANYFSLMVVGSFIVGITLGLFTPLGAMVGSSGITVYVLYLMMFSVGVTIGSDTATLRNIVRQPRRTLLVPLATIVGTWVGVVVMWGVVRGVTPVGVTLADSLAIGSAFGYYSLSTVLLGEMRGVEIATICLLANILRELVAVSAAPWIVRRFSPLGLICAGGATTVDVTLPVIIRCCGPHYVALAIFQGVVIDLSVPLLVSFFAAW